MLDSKYILAQVHELQVFVNKLRVKRLIFVKLFNLVQLLQSFHLPGKL